MKIATWVDEYFRGLHKRVSHVWERLPNGRWRSLCGTVPERWTRPLPSEETDCGACRRERRNRRAGSDPVPAVEERLAVLWPRGLMVTHLRRLHHTLRREGALERVMSDLEERGRVTHAETPSGRKMWAARRAVVEEHGRTYGMEGSLPGVGLSPTCRSGVSPTGLRA